MDRDLFRRRFIEAASQARDFAQKFIRESLSEPMTFRVHLNSSYDQNAEADVTRFPADSSPERASSTKHLSGEAVVDLLWRNELVPQWIDISVAAETGETTVLDLLACGRFISDEQRLYYTWTDVAPFGVKGPYLPPGYVEGERFSIHHRASCWSLSEFACACHNASKVWSLELHGPLFDDDLLATELGYPRLEILELHGVTLSGRGLRGLGRLPRLRVLRVTSLEKSEFSFGDMPAMGALASLSLGLDAPRWRDLQRLASALPALEDLSLRSAVQVEADAPLAMKTIVRLSLAFPRVPAWLRPTPALRDVSLCAPESNDHEVGSLLAACPSKLEAVRLQGTPVTDGIFDSLNRFPELKYLDVVDTQVTREALARFVGLRSGLRYHPR